MGRQDRRWKERVQRLSDKKNKLVLSRGEVSEIREKAGDRAAGYTVEALMTCFALAEHRLYGFGHKRILRSLKYIDDLMGPILTGEKTIEDYKEELREETKVVISKS